MDLVRSNVDRMLNATQTRAAALRAEKNFLDAQIVFTTEALLRCPEPMCCSMFRGYMCSLRTQAAQINTSESVLRGHVRQLNAVRELLMIRRRPRAPVAPVAPAIGDGPGDDDDDDDDDDGAPPPPAGGSYAKTAAGGSASKRHCGIVRGRPRGIQ